MRKRLLAVVVVAMSFAAIALADVSVTPTTNGAALASALGGGGGLSITGVTVMTGAASQFGTYTGFTSPPVTIGNGVVLSTGQVANVIPGGAASTDTGRPGTAEFDAYGPGRISNFDSSYDVAAILVNFTLSAPSQVGFDFVFGSIEYPVYTNNYTDAFLAFLDGTSNQIVFDPAGNAVQVGSSFAAELTVHDTNTVFADPHGLLRLKTFTNDTLAAGAHSILFEIGDVNDHILDSAVFISNLRAGTDEGGTHPSEVPEPGSVALLATVAGLLARKFYRRRAA
jgi:hypothetical protein